MNDFSPVEQQHASSTYVQNERFQRKAMDCTGKGILRCYFRQTDIMTQQFLFLVGPTRVY